MVGSCRRGGASARSVAEQLPGVVVDRADAVAREQAGEDALHHLRGSRACRTRRRHAQVVLEHDEAAVLDADQVGAGDRDVDVARHAHAAHLAPVVRAAVDQLARDDAFREDPALVVDVLQEQVERRDPLRQPALDALHSAPVMMRGRRSKGKIRSVPSSSP